jgi:hypothetical protein
VAAEPNTRRRRSAAPLHRCTAAPLHRCTAAPLQLCSSAALHHCTTAAPLHHHCTTATPLHDFTAAPLHHCTTSPLHHCTTGTVCLGLLSLTRIASVLSALGSEVVGTESTCEIPGDWTSCHGLRVFVVSTHPLYVGPLHRCTAAPLHNRCTTSPLHHWYCVFGPRIASALSALGSEVVGTESTCEIPGDWTSCHGLRVFVVSTHPLSAGPLDRSVHC